MQVSWAMLMAQIAACEKCPLCRERTQTVPGEGRMDAPVLFVGEGPGADEDATGRPFVGKAGQLLTRMLESIGLTREDVYIANIVKCRPPGNRLPNEGEIAACLPYLRAQVGLIKPQVIVCLGSTAGRQIIGQELRITRDRGNWVDKKGIAILPTYHPSALLRDERLKRPAWQDMQSLREKLLALNAPMNWKEHVNER